MTESGDLERLRVIDDSETMISQRSAEMNASIDQLSNLLAIVANDEFRAELLAENPQFDINASLGELQASIVLERVEMTSQLEVAVNATKSWLFAKHSAEVARNKLLNGGKTDQDGA